MSGPIYAASIVCSHCGHGSVFIQLVDDEGRVFGVASMPASIGAAFLADFTETVQAATQITALAAASADGRAH